MSETDIIPDIHGQFEKLKAALTDLGWRKTAAGWVHPEPGRRIAFLGDFIDRGPNNREVIETVRDLIDSGKADAVMGNHELNAVLFHTRHPKDGEPLRENSDKNIRQHRAFLNEFRPGAPETAEVVAWMASLPLFLETEDFRAVHACWEEDTISYLRQHAPNGVLNEEQFVIAGGRDTSDRLFRAVERTTKGPEIPLPVGYEIHDQEGTVRPNVRVKWWRGAGQWKDIAISVPDTSLLPDGTPGEGAGIKTYPENAKPVFFGHYWLSGNPVVQVANALCLDYSAGLKGPLVTYRYRSGERELNVENIRVHDIAGRSPTFAP